MADELAVWLYGHQVALIDADRGRPRLTYTHTAFSRYELGTPLLSLRLPLIRERFTQGVVRPFLDGLLPEGDARRAVAEDFDLRANDTYGLIRAVGRDCAGAIVIQPADLPEPPAPTTTKAEPIDEAEMERLVANLRTAPLGVDTRVRVSLAGVQEKLLLTRLRDGGWGRPVYGTPSTHILKPEIARFSETVENEAFCMRIAHHLGLPVASVERTTVGHRKLLVVERFDRVVHPDGSVERVHQEDFCQATGMAPGKKYEEDGGPSLRRIAGIVDTTGPDGLDALLRAVTLNAIVGNGDAHAKNFSLLHEETGRLRLAPAYDVMSTLVYGDDHLAMYIDNVHRTNRLTAARIVNEAASWGMSRGRAVQIIEDILARVPEAIDAARAETPDLPDAFLETVHGQLAQLGSGT